MGVGAVLAGDGVGGRGGRGGAVAGGECGWRLAWEGLGGRTCGARARWLVKEVRGWLEQEIDPGIVLHAGRDL